MYYFQGMRRTVLKKNLSLCRHNHHFKIAVIIKVSIIEILKFY